MINVFKLFTFLLTRLAPSPCLSDHDCPINFNCNYGLCAIADCNLTDEPEIILQEGRTCFIDDDCYFETPFDSDNWKCLPDPWCFHNKTCDISYNYCKRCPTGYIDADPKRFTSSDGSIQPPTTSSPWWLTASPTTPPPSSSSAHTTPPTTDINRLYNPIDQPFVHDHYEHSVPNITESPIDSISLSTPSIRVTTPSTTPDPITVGYDELSPNTDENHSNNNSGGNTETNTSSNINTNTSTISSNFGASDLPVNLSDDELISNVTLIELARIDSVDSVDDILNSTDSVTPSPSPLPISSSAYELSTPIESSESPSSSLFSSSQPISSFPSSSPDSSSITDPSSYTINFESRPSPVAPLVTSNPFAWLGLFETDLNRTSTVRNVNNNNSAIEGSTTNIPNFTDINYI